MSMIIIPLPLSHYDNFFNFFFLELEKKGVAISPPPLSDSIRANAAVARHFALPKQTPWRRPEYKYKSHNKQLKASKHLKVNVSSHHFNFNSISKASLMAIQSGPSILKYIL